MKIIVEVDTRNPQSAEEIRREAQYLLYVAANLDTFLAGAAAAGASVGTASLAVEATPAVAAQVPPPPPPAAAAPAPAGQVPPPPPAAAAPAPAGQVDKTGLPWDERIHSGSRNVNADGTWKKRKGVTPPVMAAVEAELRGAAGAATPAAQVPPPPPAATADAPPPPPAVPAVPEVPAAPAATPAAPPSPLSLLQRLAGAVSAGKVSFEDVLKEAQMYGCADLGAVAANPSVSEMIEQTFVARGVI